MIEERALEIKYLDLVEEPECSSVSWGIWTWGIWMWPRSVSRREGRALSLFFESARKSSIEWGSISVEQKKQPQKVPNLYPSEATAWYSVNQLIWFKYLNNQSSYLGCRWDACIFLHPFTHIIYVSTFKFLSSFVFHDSHQRSTPSSWCIRLAIKFNL